MNSAIVNFNYANRNFRLSPVGVLFLVASKMLEMESWEVMLGQLGMYFLTVMVGLFIHGFVVLQLIYFIVTRKLPFRYVGNLSEALATAFATSSRSVIDLLFDLLKEN